MKINLKQYLEERDRVNQSRNIEGPVVCISRQFGCDANLIAHLLINRTNELPSGPLKRHPWKYISKEIMDECSTELGLRPEEIDRRILLHHSDIVNEVFNSFTHHYNISDSVIMSKVKDIIMTYAKLGNVIIVGRGGSLVTEGMEHVLRIKLMAPEEWRIDSIAKKMGIGSNDAKELVRHFDENRVKWMEHISNREFDDSIFDLILNVSTLSHKESAELIIRLMQQKGMVPGMRIETKEEESIKSLM